MVLLSSSIFFMMLMGVCVYLYIHEYYSAEDQSHTISGRNEYGDGYSREFREAELV